MYSNDVGHTVIWYKQPLTQRLSITYKHRVCTKTERQRHTLRRFIYLASKLFPYLVSFAKKIHVSAKETHTRDHTNWFDSRLKRRKKILGRFFFFCFGRSDDYCMHRKGRKKERRAYVWFFSSFKISGVFSFCVADELHCFVLVFNQTEWEITRNVVFIRRMADWKMYFGLIHVGFYWHKAVDFVRCVKCLLLFVCESTYRHAKIFRLLAKKCRHFLLFVVDVLLVDCLLFTEFFKTDSSTHTDLSIKVSERAQTTPSRRFDFVNEIFTLHFCCFASLNGFIHCAPQCCRVRFYSRLLFSVLCSCLFFISFYVLLSLEHFESHSSNQSRSITFWAMHTNKHSHFVVVFSFLSLIQM